MAFSKKFVWFGVTILSPALCFGQTITVGSTTQQLNPSQRSSVAAYWPDGNMGAINRNGTNYIWAPTVGSAGGSVQATVSNLNSWSGNVTLDTPATNIPVGGSGAFDQNYVGGGAVYYDSASGYLIQLYHGEQWFGGSGSPFYAALGLAYSTDFGNNWHKLGEVISPQAARVNGGTNCQAEVGVGTLVPVGGYLYTYYTDTASDCTSLGIAVARASISSVIAAATAGTPFASGAGTLFMKYTGSGTWTGNGVTDLANPQNGGGAFTQIASDPAGSSYIPNVRYDSYTNTYIMVYIIVNSGNTTSQINAQTSTDGLSWSSPRTLVTGGTGFGGTNMIYYPTLLDTSGGDPQTLGQNFSVFYVQPFNQPGTGWANSGLYSTALSVGQGPLPPVLNQPTVVGGSMANSTPAGAGLVGR